jgi:hypothetical protein
LEEEKEEEEEVVVVEDKEWEHLIPLLGPLVVGLRP